MSDTFNARTTARMLADICNDPDAACPADFMLMDCPIMGTPCKDVDTKDWLNNIRPAANDKKAQVEEEDDGGPAPRPVKTEEEIQAFEQGFDLCLRIFDCFGRKNREQFREDFASKLLYYVREAENERARSVTLFRHGEYEVALDAATYKGESK